MGHCVGACGSWVMSSAIEEQLAAIDAATLARLKELVRGGVAQCGSADIAPFSGTVKDLSVCCCSWLTGGVCTLFCM